MGSKQSGLKKQSLKSTNEAIGQAPGTSRAQETSEMEKEEDGGCNMRLTTNARHLLNVAHSYARDHNCIFVGTEHYLLAMLDECEANQRFVHWLQHTVGMCLKKLKTDAQEFCTQTGDKELKMSSISSSNESVISSIYSPSLSRGLELTFALVVSPFEAGSEYLLLSILLAASMDKIPNALTNILERNKPSKISLSVLEMLMSHLMLKQVDIQHLPERTLHRFTMSWGDTIHTHKNTQAPSLPPTPSNKVLKQDFSSPVAHTHWVLPNVLCGRTAGQMNAGSLRALIEECGISVIVCLQTSYTEYGCSDYRDTLTRFVYTKSSPPPFDVKFLHCPVPDFGVLDDMSLVGLISELQKLLSEGNNIYIHCYGGHGRTGTVCVNLISAVEGIGALKALKELCSRHQYRVDERGRVCRYCALSDGELEDREQLRQTEKVQGAMKRQNKIYK